MTLLEAASSGVVQGATEFLPVSSSGHLVLLHALFGFQEPKLLFDLCLHLGTTISVLVLFWKKIALLFTKEKEKLFFIFLGCLPTGVIGVLFAKTLESFFTQPRVVGWGFWITAIWLFIGERLRPKEEGSLTWWKALIVGVSQGIAIIPGISRSGSTIATGLLLGLKGSVAVEYSFLLSIPAIVGAFSYKLLSDEGPFLSFSERGLPYAVGGGVAVFFGIFAIQMIQRLVEKKKLYFFSVYLLGLGLATFFYFGKS